jgi:hypothetical protein
MLINPTSTWKEVDPNLLNFFHASSLLVNGWECQVQPNPNIVHLFNWKVLESFKNVCFTHDLKLAWLNDFFFNQALGFMNENMHEQLGGVYKKMT